MGLFQRKQSDDNTPDDVLNFFDEHYREELRNSGREYFEKVMSENAALFKKDLDDTIGQVGTDLKAYMTTQLDATVAHVNEEITKQLDNRMAEYDRVTKDAHDLAVQSLNRSAQALHQQYEQFNEALRKSIASQEAMMITVYEENKTQIAATQEAQDQALQSLEDSVHASDERRNQLNDRLQKAIGDQEEMLTATFDESKARIAATKDAQETALQSLNQSAQALQEQYDQLSATLQKNISRQETILVDAFQDNMAQVIEHYLLDALGDQYDMKAQLPLIIKQMETNKQAIVDDIKL